MELAKVWSAGQNRTTGSKRLNLHNINNNCMGELCMRFCSSPAHTVHQDRRDIVSSKLKTTPPAADPGKLCLFVQLFKMCTGNITKTTASHDRDRRSSAHAPCVVERHILHQATATICLHQQPTQAGPSLRRLLPQVHCSLGIESGIYIAIETRLLLVATTWRAARLTILLSARLSHQLSYPRRMGQAQLETIWLERL